MIHPQAQGIASRIIHGDAKLKRDVFNLLSEDSLSQRHLKFKTFDVLKPVDLSNKSADELRGIIQLQHNETMGLLYELEAAGKIVLSDRYNCSIRVVSP